MGTKTHVTHLMYWDRMSEENMNGELANTVVVFNRILLNGDLVSPTSSMKGRVLNNLGLGCVKPLCVRFKRTGFSIRWCAFMQGEPR